MDLHPGAGYPVSAIRRSDRLVVMRARLLSVALGLPWVYKGDKGAIRGRQNGNPG